MIADQHSSRRRTNSALGSTAISRAGDVATHVKQRDGHP
jgi:hypothetical protein